MRREGLGPGEACGVIRERGCRFPGHRLPTGPADEVPGGKAAVASDQPAGREHVIGARQVVAEGHRRGLAQKDRAGPADPGEGRLRVAEGEQQVLGSVPLGESEGMVQVVRGQEGPAAVQRLGDDLRAGLGR